MRIITDIQSQCGKLPKAIVAIGVFDGVHLGHQKILRLVCRRAAECGGTSVLLSFHPHPQKVIASSDAPAQLQTLSQRVRILRELGIDVLVRLPFTRRLSLYTPKEFVRRVLCPLQLKEAHVGANFRFGHRRSGDIASLKRYGELYGFQVCETESVMFRGNRISSTRIRKLIAEGRVALAKRLLGRPYEIQGTVIKGAAKGTHLGFPTANLKTENELTPKRGVYFTRVTTENGIFAGATNIGFRPTIHGNSEPKPTVETHILDFDSDLYGQQLKLEFCCRLREEKKFENVESLLQQVAADINKVRRYLSRASALIREVNE